MSMIDITTLSIFLSDRRQNSAVAFVAWIVLGAVAGHIGSKRINKTGHSRDREILLGVVGATVVGFLSNLFRDAGVPILNCGDFRRRGVPDHFSRAFTSWRSSSKTLMI